jgi:hypothetical protein
MKNLRNDGYRQWLLGLVYLLGILGLLASCGDSGDSGDDSSDSDTKTASVTFPAAAQNVVLVTGVSQDFTTVNTFDVKALGGPFEAVTIDTQNALANLTAAVMRAGPAGMKLAAAESVAASVEIYTGLGEERDGLCNSGGSYQTLSIFVDGLNQVSSVQPAQFVASQALVDIYNSGSVATCTRVTSNVDAVVSMSGLEAEYESCTQAPADFDGDWSGNYSCTGTCSDPGGPITLTVNQNGDEATYSDGSASYNGFVCGDTFSFRGGNAGYDESGKLVLTGSNTATKTSTYREPTSMCSGSCTDILTWQ